VGKKERTTGDDVQVTMRLPDRSGAAWALGLALGAGLACNAHVNAFDATPRRFCPGGLVDISWDVTGSAELSFQPPIAGAPNGPVSSVGRASIRPSGDTRASLRVTRWLGEPTGADIDLALPAPVEIAATLQDARTCKDGVLTLTTHVGGSDPALKAALVSAPKRAVDVTRTGAGQPITAHLEPGQAGSSAFADLPFSGDWTIATKLAGTESCANPPHTLTLSVVTNCPAGTP
jgi:hypothetical protein